MFDKKNQDIKTFEQLIIKAIFSVWFQVCTVDFIQIWNAASYILLSKYILTLFRYLCDAADGQWKVHFSIN